MFFDIDIAIFVGFLLINLVLGLLSSRGIGTLKEYAIGNKDFSATTIGYTLIATWIGGSYFYSVISEVYMKGLHFIIPIILEGCAVYLIGWYFAPRLSSIIGKVSIADAMSSMYGEKVGFITSISGLLMMSGYIAVQLKITGMIFNYVFGMQEIYGIIISGFIITLYSALGGIKSVTFTDIIQFFTFGTIIPLISYHLLSSVGNIENIFNALDKNPNFDFSIVFFPKNSFNYSFLSIIFIFMIPAFNPAFFQRISMAKNWEQVRKSFYITSFFMLVLSAIICWIAILLLYKHPNLEYNEIIKTLLTNNYMPIGFKGLILAGIMAMIMSTVDSYINTSSVLIVHDLFKNFHIKHNLLTVRITSFFIGIFAILMSLKQGSLLEIILFTTSFYMPIVTVPFIMAIIGYQTPFKEAVLWGMGAGLTVVLLWNYYGISVTDSVLPGMFANLTFLIGYHYLFKKKGGWVGIKDQPSFIISKVQKRQQLKSLWKDIVSFNFLDVCKKNTPKNETLTAIFGVFIMISTFFSMNTIPKESQMQYVFLINMLYPATLSAAAVLIGYPLWASRWKETNVMAICWNIIIFFVLICFNFLIK